MEIISSQPFFIEWAPCSKKAPLRSLKGADFIVVRLGRFELPTHGLGNRCSIQLSYKRISFILQKEWDFVKGDIWPAVRLPPDGASRF